MNRDYISAIRASYHLRLDFPKSKLHESPSLVHEYFLALTRQVDKSLLTVKQACQLIGSAYWYGCARHNEQIECIALEAGRICNMADSDQIDVHEKWNFLRLWIAQTSF
jgi:hypothetical protein